MENSKVVDYSLKIIKFRVFTIVLVLIVVRVCLWRKGRLTIISNPHKCT